MGAAAGPHDAGAWSRRRSAFHCRAWVSTASTCCSSTGGITATSAISTRSRTSPTCSDEGKIRHLALTNFDTERLGVIAEHGIRIVSNQVQYSLVDRRPEARMAAFCRDHGVTLLAYGTSARRPACRRNTWAGPSRAAPSSHRVAAEIQADDRRLGRLGAVPGIARRAEGRLPTSTASASPTSACAMSSTGPRWPASSSARGSAWPSTSPTTPAPSASRSTPTISQRIEAVLARSHDLMALIGDCGDEYRR